MRDLVQRLRERVLPKHGGTADSWKHHWNLIEFDSLLHQEAAEELERLRFFERLWNDEQLANPEREHRDWLAGYAASSRDRWMKARSLTTRTATSPGKLRSSATAMRRGLTPPRRPLRSPAYPGEHPSLKWRFWMPALQWREKRTETAIVARTGWKSYVESTSY